MTMMEAAKTQFTSLDNWKAFIDTQFIKRIEYRLAKGLAISADDYEYYVQLTTNRRQWVSQRKDVLKC